MCIEYRDFEENNCEIIGKKMKESDEFYFTL